jgi:ribonuclease VapC
LNLNIKSEEAHALASELAKLTGESMTRAVTEAIRERLERERRLRNQAALAEELLAIGRRCAAHGRTDTRPHGESSMTSADGRADGHRYLGPALDPLRRAGRRDFRARHRWRRRLISAANLLEAGIVIDNQISPAAGRQLDAFVKRAAFTVAPVRPDQVRVARQAYLDFGKGNHPAGLKFGDCFAYALAKTAGEPLLFKGEDFSRTDITTA